MNTLIPIHIGFSGHIDIYPEDADLIELEFCKKFLALKKEYKNTSIRLLSGLAEGSDRVVARAAIKSGIDLVALLPMPMVEYIKDFPESIPEFNKLLDQSKYQIICEGYDPSNRDNSYIELARKIVKHSQIVFVAWDGIKKQKNSDGMMEVLAGGTAHVVEMCLEGVDVNREVSLSSPDKTYCEQWVTRRKKHIDSSLVNTVQINQWSQLTSFNDDNGSGSRNVITDNFNIKATVEDSMRKINCLNIKSDDAQKVSKKMSKIYLFDGKDQPDRCKEITHLIEAYAASDALAQSRQKQRNNSIKIVTSLVFLSILAQQIYAGLFMTFGWFALSSLMVGLSYAAYHWFFERTNENKEEQFVEWRVLAEGLRVQIFWYLSGLNDIVTDHYRTTKLNELDWIIQSINNLMLYTPTKADDSKNGVMWVRDVWLDGQYNYFIGKSNKSNIMRQRAKRITLTLKTTIYLGVVLMLFTLVTSSSTTYLYELTNPVLLAAAMAFVISALLKAYLLQMGYKELGCRYMRSGLFFEQAIHNINISYEAKSYDDAKKTIKVIGKEALNESAAWLQLNKMNRFGIEVIGG